MQTQFILRGALLAVLFTGLVGCSSEREKATETMIEVMDDFADRLEKIKTNTDIVDAKADLERIGTKWKDAMNVQQKLGEPSADERAELDKAYKSEMDRVTSRLSKEMERIGGSAGPMAVMDIMSALKMDVGAMMP